MVFTDFLCKNNEDAAFEIIFYNKVKNIFSSIVP